MITNKDFTKEALADIIKATVAETLAATGQGSGEISQSQAIRLYGRWFSNAVAAGKLQPVGHSSNKATSTKWYSILDIRSLRAAENIKAEIQSKQQL